MPPRRGFKQVLPLSIRKLRPLASRVKNVEETIELVEELVKLESEKRKTKASTSDSISSEESSEEISEETNSSSKVSPSSEKIESTSDTNSTDSNSLPTTPGTVDHDRFADEMDNPPGPIDPMMRPRGLPIVVPPNLREIPIPTNLPKFSGSWHKDPTAHVERFEEMLVSSLVTNPGHYLIWFPNTLMDSAYSWYRSHAPRTFTTWDHLQTAFLRQFRPETGQQQALAA